MTPSAITLDEYIKVQAVLAYAVNGLSNSGYVKHLIETAARDQARKTGTNLTQARDEYRDACRAFVSAMWAPTTELSKPVYRTKRYLVTLTEVIQ